MPMSDRAVDGFLRLYKKFRKAPAKIGNWESIRGPDEKSLLSYESLKKPDAGAVKNGLSKAAVCKLNGGLGTSMGCRAPKSSINVRQGKSFLDLIVEQLREMNREFQAGIPLILMNSFYTHEETGKTIQKYGGRVDILSFQQNRFPRLLEDPVQPLDEKIFRSNTWYPPGHGNFYSCIRDQGILDRLLEEGREILFVSNADNLGAVLDPVIVNTMLENDIPFLMEMTEKTAADVKGGTLYQEDGKLKLLEIAQVPQEHVAEFCGQAKFKVFNTNNIWVNLIHLRNRLNQGPLDLDVIVNRKNLEGTPVIQLETAIGAALECFPRAVGLTVARDRFLPVKKTDDLFLVQSDLFFTQKGRLIRNPGRKRPGLPWVQLRDPFQMLDEYQSRIPTVPSILELESLELEGDVRFGKNVTLKGCVRLVARNRPLLIADGSVVENAVVEQ